LQDAQYRNPANVWFPSLRQVESHRSSIDNPETTVFSGNHRQKWLPSAMPSTQKTEPRRLAVRRLGDREWPFAVSYLAVKYSIRYDVVVVYVPDAAGLYDL
jgi:hypothetical protein